MSDPTHTPPPSETPEPLQDALRRLTMRATVDALEFTQRIKELRDQFDGTALDGGEGSAVSSRPRRDAGELLYEIARLHLQVANELLVYGHSEVDFWLDRAQRAGMAMLPREQRPPTRVSCARSAHGERPAWKVFAYNASHEPRALVLTGAWRAVGGGPAEPFYASRELDGCVVPPREQRAVIVYHEWTDALRMKGEHVADLEASLMPTGLATSPGTSIGRLQFGVTVS